MAISLSKGQKISLKKAGGDGLSKVIMGLGWDVAPAKKSFFGLFTSEAPSVDLDASCVLFDAGGQMVDAVWFKQLVSKDNSIRHTGDNRTGAGEGDDEQIIVELTKVPRAVKSLVFIVNSYTGQSFDQIQNAYCRLIDARNNKEIARYQLASQGSHTAQIMAKVYRHEGEWKMHAIGDNAHGKTIKSLLPNMQAIL